MVSNLLELRSLICNYLVQIFDCLGYVKFNKCDNGAPPRYSRPLTFRNRLEPKEDLTELLETGAAFSADTGLR